jgi:serine protease Do
MASRSVLLCMVVFAWTITPAIAAADKILFVSDPPGATVEIDGKSWKTPFEVDFPGYYFHDPHILVSKHLNHQLVAHVTLSGYASKDIPLTGSTLEWASMNGHKRYNYWIVRANYFPIKLERIPMETEETSAQKPAVAEPPVQVADKGASELLQRATAAVVDLKNDRNLGSGFFVSSAGIIATSKHVVDGQKDLKAALSSREELPAEIVYVDPHIDFALLRVSGEKHPFLTFSEKPGPKPGEKVFAIGNPTHGLPASVSQGIVSALGEYKEVGQGTWVQTDASISRGFSGGPLLNENGEVIGITARKAVGDGVSGIGFALSSSDVLPAFRKYLESISASFQDLSADPKKEERSTSGQAIKGRAKVSFTTPWGAHILIDHISRGNVPSTLSLTPGKHLIGLRKTGHAEWSCSLTVAEGDEVTVVPDDNWMKASP